MKKFTFYKFLSIVLMLVLTVSTIKSFSISPKVEIESSVFTATPIPLEDISLDIKMPMTSDMILLKSDINSNLKITNVVQKQDEELIEIKEEEPKEVVVEEVVEETPKEIKEEKQQEVITTVQVTASGYSDWEIYEWAKIVYCEAGGESQLCKEYIAQVILNRINSTRFPNTVHGVIFQGRQFSPTFDGSWERKEPDQSCYDAVYTVINSPTPLTNALFFEACRGSSWHSRNLTEVAAIDSTRFYTY